MIKKSINLLTKGTDCSRTKLCHNINFLLVFSHSSVLGLNSPLAGRMNRLQNLLTVRQRRLPLLLYQSATYKFHPVSCFSNFYFFFRGQKHIWPVAMARLHPSAICVKKWSSQSQIKAVRQRDSTPGCTKLARGSDALRYMCMCQCAHVSHWPLKILIKNSIWCGYKTVDDLISGMFLKRPGFRL